VEQNPFQAPQTIQSLDPTVSWDGSELQMTYKQLKKLYYHSKNLIGVNVMVAIFLIAFAGVISIIGDRFLRVDHPGIMARHITILVLTASLGLTFIGLIVRSRWGRIAAIIVSFLLCLGGILRTVAVLRSTSGNVVELGFCLLIVLVFAVGFVTLLLASRLFGPNRITHAQLKAAYRLATMNPEQWDLQVQTAREPGE